MIQFRSIFAHESTFQFNLKPYIYRMDG